MNEILPTRSADAPTWLLIEDNPGDARLIREMLLESVGSDLRLDWVERLTDGLVRLARTDIGLVLLDLSLPETQGLDSYMIVRDHAPGVPVVVLTGVNDKDLAIRAVQAGAQDYLVKGQVDGPLLVRAIRYAIERGRIDEELRQRASYLEELDRRKDEFLEMLAHELRNPLAAIHSAIAFAQEFGSRGGQPVWYMEVVNRQMRRLERLIDDLLDISCITLGKIQVKKENIDLTAVLQRAAEAVWPLLEERKHDLSVSLSAPLRVNADPIRLEQTVISLLTNAVKFTESGGKIALTGVRRENEVIITVKDNGIGIAPEKLSAIFELFTQVGHPAAALEGGLGVGLTLAKTLVELHAGSIVATSNGPGLGSEFNVRLPAVEAPFKDPSEVAPPALGAEPDLSRVLIVDQVDDATRGLANLLEYVGHQVWRAQDTSTALELARAHSPQFILLPIGGPETDGFQIARELREDECCRRSLFIAVARSGHDQDRRRSIEAGFDIQLSTPIDHVALLTLLGNRIDVRA